MPRTEITKMIERGDERIEDLTIEEWLTEISKNGAIDGGPGLAVYHAIILGILAGLGKQKTPLTEIKVSGLRIPPSKIVQMAMEAYTYIPPVRKNVQPVVFRSDRRVTPKTID